MLSRVELATAANESTQNATLRRWISIFPKSFSYLFRLGMKKDCAKNILQPSKTIAEDVRLRLLLQPARSHF